MVRLGAVVVIFEGVWRMGLCLVSSFSFIFCRPKSNKHECIKILTFWVWLRYHLRKGLSSVSNTQEPTVLWQPSNYCLILTLDTLRPCLVWQLISFLISQPIHKTTQVIIKISWFFNYEKTVNYKKFSKGAFNWWPNTSSITLHITLLWLTLYAVNGWLIHQLKKLQIT